MTHKKTVMSFAGLILLLAGSIYGFTRPFFVSLFNVDNNKEVADIIDALTAPVIGIVGAILVYVSFREQVKANKIQSLTINEQRELELMYKFYEELKGDLQRMQVEYGPKYGQPAILDSLMNYVYDSKHADSPYPEFERYLLYVFNQFLFISNRVKRNRTLSPSELVYIIEKINYLYDLYLASHHKRLAAVIPETSYGRKIRDSLEEVHVRMSELENVRSYHKGSLRARVEHE